MTSREILFRERPAAFDRDREADGLAEGLQFAGLAPDQVVRTVGAGRIGIRREVSILGSDEPRQRRSDCLRGLASKVVSLVAKSPI